MFVCVSEAFRDLNRICCSQRCVAHWDKDTGASSGSRVHVHTHTDSVSLTYTLTQLALNSQMITNSHTHTLTLTRLYVAFADHRTLFSRLCLRFLSTDTVMTLYCV